MGDELSHYVDYKKGVPYTEKRQAVSTLYGDDAGDQMRNYGGDEAGDYARFQERMAEYDFTKANERVRRVDGMEERVYSAARDLNEFPIGTHQFAILIPDNPKDFDDNKLKELGVEPMRDLGNGDKGWVIGGHKKEDNKDEYYLRAEFFEKSDIEATREFFDPKIVKWYKSDFDTEVSLVKHKGKTDTEYITDLLKNTKNYQYNQSSMPILYPKPIDQYAKGTWNSNSWNNSNLRHAGGTEYQTDFKGMDAARDNIIPKHYFNDLHSSESDEKHQN